MTTTLKSLRPKTGSDIDAFCSKCDLDLAHVIVAMVGDRPVKVQCKTCNTTHVYRGKRAVDGPRTRTTSTGKGAAKAATGRASSRGEYDRAIEGKDLSRAKRYKPATTYATEDIIDHPTFRFGVVTRLLSDGKIEVIFEAGMKTLVHAREAAAVG